MAGKGKQHANVSPDNSIFPNPVWEHGARFEIFSSITIQDRNVNDSKDSQLEKGNKSTGSKSIPWPAELMRRIEDFQYEDDETIGKLTLLIDNSDYQITEVRSGDHKIEFQAEQPYSGVNVNQSKSKSERKKAAPKEGQVEAKGTKLDRRKSSVVFKDYFELGMVIGIRWGYGGVNGDDRFMSPAKVVKITTVTGFKQIKVEGYETFYALGTLNRTTSWHIKSKRIARILRDSGFNLNNVGFGGILSASELTDENTEETPVANRVQSDDSLENSHSKIEANNPDSKGKPLDDNDVSALTPSGIYIGDKYVLDSDTKKLKDGFVDNTTGKQNQLEFEIDSRKLPHAGVVSMIARSHGFKARVVERFIDDEKEIAVAYSQTHENDLAFLQRSAKNLGYVFWIELASDYFDRLNSNNSKFSITNKKKPLGTFYFMPRMYWQTPYATYNYAFEPGPEGKFQTKVTTFDSIIEFSEPTIDARLKSTLLGGADINPLTGKKYSARNNISQGFQFSMFGSNFYDWASINQAFKDKIFNRIGENKKGELFREEFIVGLSGRIATGEFDEQGNPIFTERKTFNDDNDFGIEYQKKVKEARISQEDITNQERQIRIEALELFIEQEKDKEKTEVYKTLLQLIKAEAEAEKSGVQVSNRNIPSISSWELTQKLTGSFQQDLEGSITSKMKTPGDPFLLSKRVVEVDGVGMYSAKYYVKKVTHQINRSGYFCDADIMTNATAFAKENTRETIESRLNKRNVSPFLLRETLQKLLDRAGDIQNEFKENAEEISRKLELERQEKLREQRMVGALYFINKKIEPNSFLWLDKSEADGAPTNFEIHSTVNSYRSNVLEIPNDPEQRASILLQGFSLINDKNVPESWLNHLNIGIPNGQALPFYPKIGIADQDFSDILVRVVAREAENSQMNDLVRQQKNFYDALLDLEDALLKVNPFKNAITDRFFYGSNVNGVEIDGKTFTFDREGNQSADENNHHLKVAALTMFFLRNNVGGLLRDFWNVAGSIFGRHRNQTKADDANTPMNNQYENNKNQWIRQLGVFMNQNLKNIMDKEISGGHVQIEPKVIQGQIWNVQRRLPNFPSPTEVELKDELKSEGNSAGGGSGNTKIGQDFASTFNDGTNEPPDFASGSDVDLESARTRSINVGFDGSNPVVFITFYKSPARAGTAIVGGKFAYNIDNQIGNESVIAVRYFNARSTSRSDIIDAFDQADAVLNSLGFSRYDNSRIGKMKADATKNWDNFVKRVVVTLPGEKNAGALR